MREIDESMIRKMVDRMYRDCLVTADSSSHFLKLKYNHKHFKALIPDKQTFHSVVGYLPNSKHRGKPFVLSVVFNKGTEEYELIIQNPNL